MNWVACTQEPLTKKQTGKRKGTWPECMAYLTSKNSWFEIPSIHDDADGDSGR